MPPIPPIRQKDPDLSRLVTLIGSAERDALARIREALRGHTDALPTATLAVRWALLELDRQLEADDGPTTRPPK